MISEADIRPLQQIAFVMAQIVCANAELEAMKAADRETGGIHTPAEYLAVPDKYGLGHNSVLTTLRA